MPTTLVNDPSTMFRTPDGGGALFFHTLTPDSVGVCTLLRFQLPDGTGNRQEAPTRPRTCHGARGQGVDTCLFQGSQGAGVAFGAGAVGEAGNNPDALMIVCGTQKHDLLP
jgi:hypothetical protein